MGPLILRYLYHEDDGCFFPWSPIPEWHVTAWLLKNGMCLIRHLILILICLKVGFRKILNSLFHVEFSIKKRIRFIVWEKKAFWKLIGNVEILNVNNEVIQTLYSIMMENEGRFYSDKLFVSRGKTGLLPGLVLSPTPGIWLNIRF